MIVGNHIIINTYIIINIRGMGIIYVDGKEMLWVEEIDLTWGSMEVMAEIYQA